MLAFGLDQSNGTGTLKEIDLAQPIAGDQEVVVSVRAAGVTPGELVWYPTTHTREGAERILAVPGHEFSGVIASLGTGVADFAIGDEVIGMNDWFAQGATAEQCIARAKDIVRKPATLSPTVAASIPISTLTAWQGLVDRCKVRAGERVLIVGASGSVGLMAVQIAAMHGCDVVASASSQHAPLLKSLGCSSLLDYHSGPFEQYVRDVDVVFDAVGAETLLRAESILRPGGRMVTIAADAERVDQPAIKKAFFIVEPSSTQLQHLTNLIAEGTMRTFVKAVLPVSEASQAYLGSPLQAGVGKVVLDLQKPEATTP